MSISSLTKSSYKKVFWTRVHKVEHFDKNFKKFLLKTKNNMVYNNYLKVTIYNRI